MDHGQISFVDATSDTWLYRFNPLEKGDLTKQVFKWVYTNKTVAMLAALRGYT